MKTVAIIAIGVTSALVGGGVALLLAPQTGADLRKKIGGAFASGKDSVVAATKKLGGSVSDAAEKAVEVAEKAVKPDGAAHHGSKHSAT